MVSAREVSRKEACEPTEDSSSSRQRRISLFRTTSLRSQMMSASSSSASSSTTSSPKVTSSSPHALCSSKSIRPPPGAHQNSRLRRQTSLKAFDRREGASKSFPHVSGLPVRKGRTSLGPKREEAPVDEFGVVAAVASVPGPREQAATATSTLPLFSRRHSVSRPPSCTVSTGTTSTTTEKTLTKHNCTTEVRKTHHTRISSTSSATITASSSSNVPPRLPTYSSTPPIKVTTAARRDVRQQRADTAILKGYKTTTTAISPPSSSVISKIKSITTDGKDAKDSRRSFHLPCLKSTDEGGIASRSPHTPTPTPTQGKIQATSKAMPWAKWGGRPDHLEGRGSIQDQHEIESSTGLDMLDITLGSQLLQEEDELEEMLKAEMDVLGIVDHSSSTIHKSSPPCITLPTVGNVEKETTFSSTVSAMDLTASQRKMEEIKLERDEALRQWQESQEELCQIQERLAELEAAAVAAGEQDIERAEKFVSTHQRQSAPTISATSQTDAKDDEEDVVGSSDDTLTETVRLCRMENVRDSWRQAAQLAKHQIEMLEMQTSVTGYLMDQLDQLERGLL